MSELGQSRHFSRRPSASGLPRSTDILRVRLLVSKVLQADVSSILRVRTLGRCKPVAQSLLEAAVPDAI
jgi:hypothetical protein